MTKPLAWYVIPGVTVASLTALGAVGGAIVMAAKFITMPQRVEAMETKNIEQDKWLDKLSVIADQNQQLLDRAAARNVPPRPTWRWTEWEEQMCWGCNAPTVEACWETDRKGRNGWRPC